MSIADKLMEIADKIPQIYNTGFQKGMKEAEGNGDTTAAYNQGYKEGKDSFWETYQEGGNRKMYRYAFAGSAWTQELLDSVKYPIIFPVEATLTERSCLGMFSFLNLRSYTQTDTLDMTEFCKKIDFSGCKTANNLFYCACVRNLTLDLSNCDTLAATFHAADGGNIDNIKLKVSRKATFTNTFLNSYIKNIEFMEGSEIGNNINFSRCAGLTKASIDSIADALITDGASRTVTFHADVELSPEQEAKIRGKGWDIVQ